MELEIEDKQKRIADFLDQWPMGRLHPGKRDAGRHEIAYELL